jgi:hypothetical protein
MRIMYQGGKLWLSLTKSELDDVNKKKGRATEMDIGLIPVLHDDITEIIREAVFKEALKDEWWDKIPHGPSMGD